jgi:hypothetical protein
MPIEDEDTQEIQDVEQEEPIKFGYGASIVFLIFIGFVIYTQSGFF